MRNVTLFVLLVLLSLGTACTGRGKKITSAMDSWMGSHYSELLKSWGPPDRTSEDGKGGQILVWDYSTSSTSTRVTRVPNTDIAGSPESDKRIRNLSHVLGG